MTTFNWSIVSMPTYPQEAGEVDVIFQVNWQCAGIDEKGTAVSFGSVSITYKAGTPFFTYNELTQEQIWEWINPSINRLEVETNLQKLIDEKTSTTKPSLPLQQETIDESKVEVVTLETT
jgi:hypothetical protein